MLKGCKVLVERPTTAAARTQLYMLPRAEAEMLADAVAMSAPTRAASSPSASPLVEPSFQIQYRDLCGHHGVLDGVRAGDCLAGQVDDRVKVRLRLQLHSGPQAKPGGPHDSRYFVAG